uniref:Uncharacterized protein n=1 Tax=Acrobeloides nanus TaxID=290746 RepID=A0A914ERE7_9BILA
MFIMGEGSLAFGNISPGHLLSDICVRLFASGNICPGHLSPVHLRPDILQVSGHKCPGRNCLNANVRDGSFRTQMSGLNYSDGKVRDANFWTQDTPRLIMT